MRENLTSALRRTVSRLWLLDGICDHLVTVFPPPTLTTVSHVTCATRCVLFAVRRYGLAKEAVCNGMGLTDEELLDVTGQTAQNLFGAWPDAA